MAKADAWSGYLPLKNSYVLSWLLQSLDQNLVQGKKSKGSNNLADQIVIYM